MDNNEWGKFYDGNLDVSDLIRDFGIQWDNNPNCYVNNVNTVSSAINNNISGKQIASKQINTDYDYSIKELEMIRLGQIIATYLTNIEMFKDPISCNASVNITLDGLDSFALRSLLSNPLFTEEK